MTDQEWIWKNGKLVDTSHWNDGQPDNEGGNEHCAEINPLDINGEMQAGKWNDKNCTIKQQFVCEVSAG